MSYTLDQFTADCHDALKADPGLGGREKVLECVKKALKDDDFLAAHFGETAVKRRNVIYEDPDLGFCVCIHVGEGAYKGEPHHHGPTWAIYGQALGETVMTEWEVVAQATDDKPAKVRQTNSYKMTPGDARLYPVGAIHAPERDSSNRLLRIEGTNTDKFPRTPFDPV